MLLFIVSDTAWPSCLFYTRCIMSLVVILRSIPCNDTLVSNLMTYQNAMTSLNI